jgi:WD40 repeat protein
MIGNVDKWLNELPPENHNEILLNVIKHLIKSKKQEKYEIAIELLLSFSFLKNKIVSFDPQMAIIDYNLVLDRSKEVKSEVYKSLQLIHNAIQQSAHLLEKNIEQLASQLFGRLKKGESLLIDKLIDEIDSQTIQTWLQPSYPSLSPAQGNLQKVFTGHLKEITSLEICHDLQQFISGSEDGTIKIWNTSEGICTQTLNDNNNDGKITSLKSINDKYILSISCGQDQSNLKLWNSESGGLKKRVSKRTNKETKGIETLSSGKYIVTNNLEDINSLVIWNSELLEPIKCISHKNEIDAFKTAFYENTNSHRDSSNGIHFKNIIISCSSDQEYPYHCHVRIDEWNDRRGLNSVKNFVLKTNNIKEIVVYEDLNKVLLWDIGGRIVVIDLLTWIIYKVIVPNQIMYGALLMKSGEQILSFTSDSKIRLWELGKTSKLLKTFPGYKHTVETGIINDNYNFSWGMDGGLKVWDVLNAEIIKAQNNGLQLTSHLKFLDEGSFITTDHGNTEIHFWKLESNTELHKRNHKKAINVIKFFDNGSKVISGSCDRLVKIYNSEDNKCFATLTGNKEQINDVEVFKNEKGTFAVSVSGELFSKGAEIKAWNLSTFKSVLNILGHKEKITKVKIINSGNTIVSLSWDGTAKAWDTNSGRWVRTFPLSTNNEIPPITGNDIKVLCQGQLLVTAANKGNLRIWNSNSGELLGELVSHSDDINSCEISTNENYLLSVSSDTTIKLWDIKSLKCIKTYIGHKSFVIKAFFISIPYHFNKEEKRFVSPEKKNTTDNYIVSFSYDSVIKVWDLQSEKCVLSFKGHNHNITSLVPFKFYPMILTTSAGGDVTIWNILNGEVLTSISIGRSITACALSPNEEIIVLGEGNGQIHFLQVKNKPKKYK